MVENRRNIGDLYSDDLSTEERWHPPEKEGKRENREVTRACAFHLRKPDECFAYWNGNFADLHVTGMYWIVRNEESEIPYTIMPPGGNMLPEESHSASAQRQLMQQLRVPFTAYEDVYSERRYSYTRDSGEIRDVQERIMYGIAAPYTTPVRANAVDQIGAIISLNPRELEYLFSAEHITDTDTNEQYTLVDSMRVREHEGVTTDGRTETVKENMLIESYKYELQVKALLIRRFVEKYYYFAYTLLEIDVVIDEIRESNTLGDLERMNQTLIDIDSRIRSDNSMPEHIKKQQLKNAYRDIFFDNATLFLKTVDRDHENNPVVVTPGPQTPFLVSHALISMDQISPYVLRQLHDISPELYFFYRSVTEAFFEKSDEAMADENWYQHTQQVLESMRDTLSNRDERSRVETKLKSLFTAYAGIARSADITGNIDIDTVYERYANYVNEFLNYIEKKLLTVGSDSIHPFIDSDYVQTNSLLELTMVAFGVNTYNTNSLPDQIRFQALRKIIAITQMARVEDIHSALSSKTVFPLRKAIANNFPVQSRDNDQRYSSGIRSFFEQVRTLLIDQEYFRSPLVVPLYTKYDTKQVIALYRKILERDSLPPLREHRKSHSNRHEDEGTARDVLRLGVAVGLQFDETFPDVKIETEKDKKRLERAIGVNVIRHFLKTLIHDIAVNHSAKDKASILEISNIKTSRDIGPMLHDIVLQFGTVLGDNVIDWKKESRHKGSAASKIDEVYWVKCVFTIDGVSIELQLFPTEDDLLMKKIDDEERFSKLRLLIPGSKSRQPLIDTLLYQSTGNQTNIREMILQEAYDRGIL